MERPEHFHEIEWNNEFRQSQKDAALENIRSSCGRKLETLTKMQAPHGMKMVLVGSGPSAAKHVETIRELSRTDGYCVMSVNESHDWLVDNEIEPWGAVYIEIGEWDIPMFDKFSPGVTFFLASQCHPSVFDQVSDRRIVLWHALQGIGEDKVIADCQGGGDLIAGGVTPAMRGIHLGIVMGFMDFELFGMDSSYETNSHASRENEREDWKDEPTIEVWCLGKMFKTKPYLARQAEDFGKVCRLFGNLIAFRVHGDGLLPHIHRTFYPQYYREKAA